MAAPASTLPAGVASSAPLATDFASGIYSFLQSLPANTLARLYTAPASCLAIFRLLPLMARHMVMNMLWVEGPLPREDVELWAGRGKGEGRRHLEETIGKLSRLHIVDESAVATGARNARQSESNTVFVLSPAFRENFRRALTGGGGHHSFGVPCDASDQMEQVSIEELDAYGTERWETILHFMVGSSLQRRPSDRVLALLQRSGLMAMTQPRTKSMQITSKGFQFLLEDVNTQLWGFLLQYFGLAEANNMDLVEVLGCVFMLGSLELGRQYSLANLSSTQRQVLTDSVDYGLVMLSADERFYPTRLAATLTSSAPPLMSSQGSEDDKGFLILETNYRTYAYTSNPLQIAVLNLFTSLRYRFPNLVVGAITRESIKSALADGITADQIIAYLTAHAHPQMRKKEPLLPPTVVDQIKLWELEKNRIRDQNGFLYEDFRSVQDYELVVQYARQIGVILWENEGTRKFFVAPEGHNTLREFIKRRTGG